MKKIIYSDENNIVLTALRYMFIYVTLIYKVLAASSLISRAQNDFLQYINVSNIHVADGV